MGDPAVRGKRAYKMQGRIAGGSFGDVFQAVHLQTGRLVAIKRIFERAEERGVERPDPTRELRILKSIDHANILPLLDSYVDTDGAQMLVSPLMTGGTLRDVLAGLGEALDEATAKGFLQQLLGGLSHLHTTCGIVHRDLKASNLLLGAGGALVIADFGQARWLPCRSSPATESTESIASAELTESASSATASDEAASSQETDERGDRPMTPHTGTRWLRAPELLFGDRSYGAAVDIWSVGCIAVQLLTGIEPFRAEADIAQIARIADYLGFPTPQQWPELASLPDGDKLHFSAREGLTLEELLPGRSDACLSFIKSTLTWRASDRATANQLLSHEWLCTPSSTGVGNAKPLLPPLLPHCVVSSTGTTALPVVVVRSDAAVSAGMGLPGAWAASEALAVLDARASAVARADPSMPAQADPSEASSVRVAIGGSAQLLSLFDRQWGADDVAKDPQASAAVWTAPSLPAVAMAALAEPAASHHHTHG